VSVAPSTPWRMASRASSAPGMRKSPSIWAEAIATGGSGAPHVILPVRWASTDNGRFSTATTRRGVDIGRTRRDPSASTSDVYGRDARGCAPVAHRDRIDRADRAADCQIFAGHNCRIYVRR
jgi:hypothetical protein